MSWEQLHGYPELEQKFIIHGHALIALVELSEEPHPGTLHGKIPRDLTYVCIRIRLEDRIFSEGGSTIKMKYVVCISIYLNILNTESTAGHLYIFNLKA